MDENQQMDVGNAGPVEVVDIKKSSSKKTIIAAVAVLVVAAAAFVGYKAYASPGRVWQKFLANDSSTLFNTKVSESFKFSYEDLEELGPDTQGNPMAQTISKIKVSLDGTAYIDYSNTASPEFTMDMDYSLGSGDTSLSSRFQMVNKGPDLYLNLGDNPFITGIFSLISPDQKIEWLKINFGELQEVAKQANPQAPAPQNFSQIMESLKGIVAKHMGNLVTVDKFIDSQDLRGVRTLHYSNKLDKTVLKTLIHECIDSLIGQSTTNSGLSAEEMEKIKQGAYSGVDAIIDRLEIKVLETWIGQSDYRLYKVKFASNAPSIMSLVSPLAQKSTEELSDPGKTAESLMENVSFNASLTYEQEFYDYGKAKEVKVPENAFDLGSMLKGLMTPPQMQIDPGLDDSKLME